MWKGWNTVPERGVVDLIDEDAQQGSSLVVRIGLELGVDIEDKCRCDGGEQASLLPSLARVHENITRTHKDQRGAQVFIVFLEEFLVILLRNLTVLLVKLSLMVFISGRYILSLAGGESE